MKLPLPILLSLLVVLAGVAHAEPDAHAHLQRWRAWCERPASVVTKGRSEQPGSVFPGVANEPHAFVHRLLVSLYPDHELVLGEHLAEPPPLPRPEEPCEWLFFTTGNQLRSANGPEFRQGWHTEVNFTPDGTWVSESTRALGAAYAGLGFYGGLPDCDLPVFLSTLPRRAIDAEAAEVAGRPAVRLLARGTRLGEVVVVLDAATGVPFELSVERSAGDRVLGRRLPGRIPYAGDRVLHEIGHHERVTARWSFGETGPVPLGTTYRQRFEYEEGVDAYEVVSEVLAYEALDKPDARVFDADFPSLEGIEYEATEMPEDPL